MGRKEKLGATICPADWDAHIPHWSAQVQFLELQLLIPASCWCRPWEATVMAKGFLQPTGIPGLQAPRHLGSEAVNGSSGCLTPCLSVSQRNKYIQRWELQYINFLVKIKTGLRERLFSPLKNQKGSLGDFYLLQRRKKLMLYSCPIGTELFFQVTNQGKRTQGSKA